MGKNTLSQGGPEPDFLHELKQGYAKNWPKKKEVLVDLTKKCCTPEFTFESLHHLRNEFHRLVGSGATYGFPEVTELARHAEGILDTAIKGTLQISEADKAKIEKIIVSLDESFTRAK